MKIAVIKITPEFEDERGFISRLVDKHGESIKSILFIKRKKGSIGANHYHKTDAHYLYILKGKVKHSEQQIGKKNAPVVSVILKPGDLVYTPSLIAHKDDFLEDSEFLAFALKHREQEHYEQDTVRVELP